ncbi:MAG: SUMF1/EgtB/PvdO family nonheme iron enzyme [Pseudonocardia sp.]
MPAIVQLWSGREARALREAKRMSIRAFAAHLGVSERMIAKWEAAGESIHPRPVNQAALDTSLGCSGTDVQERFGRFTNTSFRPASEDLVSDFTSLSVDNNHQIRHPVDGKLMTLISEGIFFSGVDDEPIWLPAFYVDLFPTTNIDYSRFVAAAGRESPSHWEKPESPPDGIFDHPVVFVTWRDASAYATWAAKTLPTSRQWEKVARGTRGDVYPWGSQQTPAKCNVREGDVRSTTPVSRYHSGVSPYGVYDMCGNTWEWCATETDPGRYELKGSAFTSPFFRAAPSTFNDAFAGMSDDDTSFRCVTSVETMKALLAVQRRQD